MNEKITEKLDEIIDELIPHLLARDKHLGLFSGRSGVALLIYLYSKKNKRRYHDLVFQFINQSFDLIGKRQSFFAFTFCDGLQGFGWLINFLQKNEPLFEVDLSSIDLIAFERAKLEFSRNNLDFLHGAIGNMIYLSNRSKSVEYQGILLRELSNCKREDKNGYYWIDKATTQHLGKEVVNFGLSHGLSSIAVLLSRLIIRFPDLEPNCKDLLEGTISYILSKKEQSDLCSFPTRIIEGTSERIPRLAWCYGDLGVNVALLQAARALKNAYLESECLGRLKAMARCMNLTRAEIIDACFCHGSSGVAHIFKRLFLETKDITFQKANEYWTKKTLGFATHNEGLAGYKTYRTEVGFVNQFPLLEGITGTALSLLSSLSISEEELSWDDCLLLS